MCVQRYMIASLRLRMTDPKPSDISDRRVSASSSLSVSLIQAIINLGIFTVVIN